MESNKRNTEIRYAICLENGGYDLDLIPLNVYAVLPPRPNETDLEYIQVIDETGEDYLYPTEFFAPVELSETVEENVKRILAERKPEGS